MTTMVDSSELGAQAGFISNRGLFGCVVLGPRLLYSRAARLQLFLGDEGP